MKALQWFWVLNIRGGLRSIATFSGDSLISEYTSGDGGSIIPEKYTYDKKKYYNDWLLSRIDTQKNEGEIFRLNRFYKQRLSYNLEPIPSSVRALVRNYNFDK